MERHSEAESKLYLLVDGSKLCRMRGERGWSLEELANKIGAEGSHLSYLEEGRHQAEPAVVRRLAEVFACDPLEFAEVVEEAR